jgi:hypothetical protein
VIDPIVPIDLIALHIPLQKSWLFLGGIVRAIGLMELMEPTFPVAACLVFGLGRPELRLAISPHFLKR